MAIVMEERNSQAQNEIEVRECLVCHNQSSEIRRGIRDNSETPVFRCSNCFLQFIDSPISDLREYYRSKYRDSHDTVPGQRLSSEERFIKQRPYMLDIAGRFKKFVPPGGSVLEIGCSSGHLLDAIGDKYDRYGSEWNSEDAAYVRDIGEIPCEEGSINEIYPGKKFSAIIAVQVLEHQAAPVQFLQDCKERLIGGGYLYLEVPNAWDALVTVFQNEAYRNFWYRDSHITYWSRETLASVLGGLGFEASVKATQRYGLQNHLNWIYNNEPMDDIDQAQGYLKPVPLEHPLSGIINRSMSRLDKEYRTDLIAYFCSDTIYAEARRREI